MNKYQSVGYLPGLTALAASLLATTALAGESTDGRALEILRKINENPAIAHSLQARNHALLVTGSIVKSDGKERVLYHLPATGQGMRLRGESASKTWPVQIAQAQLEGAVELRLAYLNAVSVMPEASKIGLEVNGVMIGTRPIQSPNRSKTLRFKIPNHILVPGYNAIRVFARQRHRVDCSINATHELWTDIDASKTGLVFSRGNSVLNTLDSIAALARNKAGQVGIQILANESREATQIERTMLLAQHAAIYADFDQAQMEVASHQGKGPGLDIFSGSFAELRAIAPEYANAAQNSSGLQILSRDGDERIALILIDNFAGGTKSGAEFSKKLARMFPARHARGSVQGINAARLTHAKGISEGGIVRFHDLGLQSEEFSGRLYRRSFQVNLPSDYFSADYDRAEINLATAYTAGLKSDNKFIIRVNGVTATGFSIGKPDGHVYKNKMLRLPLSAFQPGVNTVEIEAQLAKTSDAECSPTAQLTDDKRFAISGNSTIKFPRLAHLARLPDLAGTVTAGFPYVIAGKARPTVISVPNPSYAELSAAAGFATQIAIKSGVPLNFSLHYGEPPQDASNAIVVGSFSKLPPKLASTIKGIDQSAFQVSWRQMQPSTGSRDYAQGGWNNNIDTMTTAGISRSQKPFTTNSVPEPASRPVVERPTFQPQTDVLDRWGGELSDQPSSESERIGLFDQLKSLVSSVFGGSQKSIAKPGVIADPNSDILLSQRISPTDDHGVWTILTARNDQALKSGMSMISKPEIASLINGETVTVGGIDRTVTSTTIAQNYIQVRGFSLRNLHLVIAGWFSNNHLIYSLLLLGSLLGIGLVSTHVLRKVGVTEEASEERMNAK